MKPTPEISSRSNVATTKRKADKRREPSAYISVAETRTLLADSLEARNARLAKYDMVSTDDAADLARTSRVAVNAWILKGGAVGLRQTKRGFKLPRWQFEPRLWDAMPRLSSALRSKDGWRLLAFLETPLGALDGETPRVAIEEGKVERVLAIAEQEGN